MANISSIKLPDGTTYDIKDSNSGYITGMTILSYGSSTWDNFIEAYNANKVVYCRASSNANPASGSQTRLAFMAYVNNATTPTNVEFQYYRSVSSHTASQQGDQVFVYKLDKTSGWSVTTREASVKVVAGTGLGGTYSNGTMTLTGPTKVSDLTNDSGFITGYTETDPVFSASAAAGITSSDISNWNSKQAALVSGTNIKTINNESVLGSGNIDIQSGDAKNIWYGTSSTNGEDKIVTTTDGDFVLEAGNMLCVTFSYDNPYSNVTLNVDNTGAKGVKCSGWSASSMWRENEVVDFVYDGTYFQAVNKSVANKSYYGLTILSDSTSSSNSSTAATSKAVKAAYDLADSKQAALVSGTNIKTVNGSSLLGSGDLLITQPASITTTLTVAGWSSDAQTVTATGVTSSNTVIVSPSPSDMEDYTDAGIVCTAQGTNTLTFECDTTPTSAIDVNVVII